jgi:hypothetical protein
MGNPMAIVFARQTDDATIALLKKLDDITRIRKETRLGSFAVFCSDDGKLERRLAGIAEKEKLSALILTIDLPSGPAGYQIEKDAAVTVVFTKDRAVEYNRAFKTGQLDEKAILQLTETLNVILK